MSALAAASDDLRASTRLKMQAESPVRVAQFSPDGTLLALGTAKGTIELWNMSNGMKLRAWSAHRGGVQSLAFHPAGTPLASEARDRRLVLWKPQRGDEAWSVADPKGTYELAEADGINTRVTFTEDGKRVAAFGFFWDTENGKQLERYGARGPVAIRRGLLATNSQRGIHVLDMESMTEKLDIVENSVPRVEISPNGEMLALGRSLFGAGALLKRLPSGKNIGTGFLGTYWIFGVAFSPDSRLLALSGQAEAVYVFDTQTLEQKHRLDTPGLQNYWVGFSPDGKLLAAVGVNEVVRFWSMPDGKALHAK